jgi:ribonucleoside-diphosphate reductase alpha chain
MSTATDSRIDQLFTRIRSAFDVETALQPDYKPNALTIFNMRYPRKDEHGEPAETPAETHWRVASNVASNAVLYADGAIADFGETVGEAVDGTDIPFPFRTIVRQYNWMLANGTALKPFWDVVENGLDQWMDRAVTYYSELLAPLIFVPNSPTWTGAGTPLMQLAACFVLPINDSLIAGDASIMQTLSDAVAIQKTGGGNGFSFGRLRPSGSTVSTSMGEATGVVGFLSMFNDVFEHIRQGGSRRGANMGVCPVWHPDVIKFINCKTVEGKIANFNISVAITDAFMATLAAGGMWQLRDGGPDGEAVAFSWKDEVVKEVPARELWDLITRNAHVIGDPGALFIDEANRYNPCPQQYRYESTNPCGEQWLEPYGNCCLGSIAIHHFVGDGGSFDWDWFDRVHELATEFLDDVVDANGYVPAVPKLEWAAQNGRRIGLGQMGLADALVGLGLRYGSPEALDFLSQSTERMRYIAMRTSTRRAAERGAFPWITNSIYDAGYLRNGLDEVEVEMVDGQGSNTVYVWEPPRASIPRELDFGRPECDWEAIKHGIIEHGIRNSCQTTFAPTGTIASTAGVEGYGCEPMFALAFTRKVMQEEENTELPYVSDLFAKALQVAGVDEDMFEVIAAKVLANGGSCQGIEEVPESVRHIIVTAADLPGEDHVRTQAALQEFVDNSISKTINFRKEATVEEVADVYALAYKLRCKGVTIYRQGSRELEVLAVESAGETGTVEVVDTNHWPIVKPLSIPREAETDGMPSRTFTVHTPFGKMRATITELPSHPGRPFDVSLSIGKSGNDVNAFTEAIGRLVSLCLRGGIDPQEVVDQLIGIGGTAQEQTLRPDRSLSLPDAFGKLLRARIEAMAQHQQREVITVQGSNGPTTVTLEPLAEPGYQPDPTKLCPDCKQATLTFQQGCINCISCGYSKC